MLWAGHMALMGPGEVHTGFWWGDLTKRPMRRWEDKIKIDFREGEWGGGQGLY